MNFMLPIFIAWILTPVGRYRSVRRSCHLKTLTVFLFLCVSPFFLRWALPAILGAVVLVKLYFLYAV